MINLENHFENFIFIQILKIVYIITTHLLNADTKINV